MRRRIALSNDELYAAPGPAATALVKIAETAGETATIGRPFISFADAIINKFAYRNVPRTIYVPSTEEQARYQQVFVATLGRYPFSGVECDSFIWAEKTRAMTLTVGKSFYAALERWMNRPFVSRENRFSQTDLHELQVRYNLGTPWISAQLARIEAAWSSYEIGVELVKIVLDYWAGMTCDLPSSVVDTVFTQVRNLVYPSIRPPTQPAAPQPPSVPQLPTDKPPVQYRKLETRWMVDLSRVAVEEASYLAAAQAAFSMDAISRQTLMNMFATPFITSPTSFLMGDHTP